MAHPIVPDRDWLRRTAEHVRSLAYRTACDLVRIGQALAEVRGRLPYGAFVKWVEDELPWGKTQAYRLMAVAARFGGHISHGGTTAIEPTALYLLADPRVPDKARKHAVMLAEDGHPVTAAVARQLLDEYRRGTPEPSPKEARAYEQAREDRENDDYAPPDDSGELARKAAAWDALVMLFSGCEAVHLTRIEESGGDDDGGDPLVSVTAYRADPDAGGRRARNTVRRRLADAIEAAAGREPIRWCGRCKRTHPVSEFGDDSRQPDGLNRYCKASERKRLGALKKKKRAERKKAKGAGGPGGGAS